mmetsp:Transcript_52333/g.58506  ORF Transcript_52333/g.58506 Transcript_52333/m.58506 type:complete len:161 (-) Transcript_52333:918-1400(-)
MMFSSFKSQSSLVSYIAACPFYIAVITIVIQSSNRSNNYLVEAFTQQKFIGASRIVSQTVSSASLLSYCSLLSTVPSSSSPDNKSTILFVTSLPDDDDDIYSSIVTDPLPSIVIDSKMRQTPEKKKKKCWHHDSGLDSKLISAICSYHILKVVIDMVHLS